MLDYHYWKELSRLVDAFRRVGKLGGKASLTTSTENGLWKASLEIQTNPSSAAQLGPASTPTPPSAAPNQDGAAGRRRPRRRRGPASALRSQARARAHQATLAARRQGTCQTPATRVQAAPPPPPPPPSNSARLIKVLKKPIGSQFSFSNLDGARDSISSEDRLQISFERQESVEDGEEEERKEEKEEEEEEEKNEKVVQLWSPEKLRRDYITSDPSVTCGPSGKVTGSEGHVSNNIKEAEAEHDPDDYVSGVELGVACWTCSA